MQKITLTPEGIERQGVIRAMVQLYGIKNRSLARGVAVSESTVSRFMSGGAVQPALADTMEQWINQSEERAEYLDNVRRVVG